LSESEVAVNSMHSIYISNNLT